MQVYVCVFILQQQKKKTEQTKGGEKKISICCHGIAPFSSWNRWRVLKDALNEAVKMCEESASAAHPSVHLLAAHSECVLQESACQACVLWEERDGLPVEESQHGLVGRGPHPVPGAVKRVGHSWAQHVVQVDLGHLRGRQGAGESRTAKGFGLN